jgi:hypothetical protein
MFFKHVFIQLAFWFFQTVSTFDRFAIWLTVLKIISGESSFLFKETSSTSYQSVACLIVPKSFMCKSGWLYSKVISK